MKDDIVIVSAARTPVGAFNGGLSSLPAHELGKAAIQEALKRAGVEGGRVSEVIMGQILTAGQGQNPARQASIGAGIPVESPAWGVNQLCGSGLRAVALGYQAIANGDSGMQLFDQHLAKIHKAELISGTEALRLATNPEALAMSMRGLSTKDLQTSLVR